MNRRWNLVQSIDNRLLPNGSITSFKKTLIYLTLLLRNKIIVIWNCFIAIYHVRLLRRLSRLRRLTIKKVVMMRFHRSNRSQSNTFIRITLSNQILRQNWRKSVHKTFNNWTLDSIKIWIKTWIELIQIWNRINQLLK